MTNSKSGRVLVLGDNEFAALQVVRSLGRAGLRVDLTRHSERSITRHSRYVAKCHDWGHPLVETETYLEKLLDRVRREPYDLVVPTADETLLPVMQVREQIQAHVPVAAPGPLAFAAAFFKDQTIAYAKRLRIPIPFTPITSTAAEIELFADWTSYPAVLKPATSVSLGKKSRKGVRLAGSPDQLDQFLPEMLRDGCVVVQEFCRGVGIGLCFLARDGEVVAAFQHRRVHEPPSGGASSYRKSEPLLPELLAHAKQFCAETAWTGPAMLEYKFDPDSGRHVLMEINGRFWGSLSLAIHSGVDFPKLLFDLLVKGEVHKTFTYRVPYFVRHTPRDLYWLQANLRTPPNRPDLIKLGTWDVLKEVGNVLSRREGYDLESLRDPRPALHAWWLTGRGIAGDLRDKLLALLAQRKAARLVHRAQRQFKDIRGRISSSRSILFVCTGNINRSAVAEKRLDARLEGRGCEIQVASAGLLKPDGRQTSRLSNQVAVELGVDLTGHQSRVLTPAMLEAFDLVVAMDGTHLAAIEQLSPAALEKSMLLGMLDPQGVDPWIPDPYGQDRPAFHAAYERIIRSVDVLASMLVRVPAPRRPHERVNVVTVA